MRFYRNAIILVAVLAVLTGAYFLVNRVNSGKSTQTDEVINIVKIDDAEMQEMTIENDEGIYKFKKNGTEWEMISDNKFRYSKDRISGIATYFLELNAEKVVEENATDLSKYGLDKPVTITIKTADSETGMLFGNATATKESYYAMKKGDNTVYTVAIYIGENVRVKKDDLKDRALFTALSPDIKIMSLKRDDKVIFNAEMTNEAGWKMKEPIDGEVNMVKLNQSIESTIRAQVANFVEEDAKDLAQYGLDKPKYVLEIGTEKDKAVVELGMEKKDENEIYAKFKDSNDVLTFYASNLDFINLETTDFVQTLVYVADIRDVSSVDVTIDGKTVKSRIESELSKEENDKFFIDDKDVTVKGEEGKEAFKDYYMALIAVAFESVEPGAVPSGEPEIVIDYTLEVAPGRVKIEFIPKDENSYYVVKNGKYTNLVVAKSEFDKDDGVRKTYSKLIDLLEE